MLILFILVAIGIPVTLCLLFAASQRIRKGMNKIIRNERFKPDERVGEVRFFTNQKVQ